MANASSSTEPSTWLRAAPIARSRASSRVRWATRMPNVLEMMKAPTNSEMKAKTRRIVEKNPKPFFTSLAVSLAAARPVTTSSLGAILASCRRFTSTSADTPALAWVSTSSISSFTPMSCWASANVVATETTPPAESAVPNRVIPTRVSFCLPLAVTTVIALPILNLPSLAAALSMTASPRAVGARPSTTW